MNETETTPSGLEPVTDEIDLALGQVAARLKEIADSLRIGQLRLRGMQGFDRAALVRNAAARLRDVEKYAGFAARLFEEEFVEPLQTKYETPASLQAIPQRRLTFHRATKLLTALAAFLAAGYGILRVILGQKPDPGP